MKLCRKSNIVRDLKIEIELDEGRSAVAYYCTQGYPTIGVGTNIRDKSLHSGLLKSAILVSAAHADLFELDDGRIVVGIDISKHPIDYEFIEVNLNAYIHDALDSLDDIFCLNTIDNDEIIKVLANMHYQLGRDRFLKFKNMINAVKNSDYEKMIIEMRDSLWYKQTTNRADRLISRVQAVIDDKKSD